MSRLPLHTAQNLSPLPAGGWGAFLSKVSSLLFILVAIAGLLAVGCGRDEAKIRYSYAPLVNDAVVDGGGECALPGGVYYAVGVTSVGICSTGMGGVAPGYVRTIWSVPEGLPCATEILKEPVVLEREDGCRSDVTDRIWTTGLASMFMKRRVRVQCEDTGEYCAFDITFAAWKEVY